MSNPISKSFKSYLPLIIVLFFALTFQSCQSTKIPARDSIDPEAPADVHFIVAHEVEFPVTEDDNYKYIFFRFYNPHYNNPLYIANILQDGLELTKTEEVPALSHIAINFNLEDTFYGLTLGGEHQLAAEECVIPENNKYMKHCNAEKSEQLTYALKVSEKEYESTKQFVEYYLNSTELKYASGLNVKLAGFYLKRRFFTKKEKRQFGTVKYPKKSKNKKVSLENEDELDNKFVCSTFIGYVLYNNVESVEQFFDEHGIKYEYLNVTDLSLIPGMTPLFYSSWDTYNEAARAFVDDFPEFSDYLTK